MADAGMVEAEPASLLLVNGEGTLHHDSPGSRKVCRAIQRRPAGAHVAVINTVWQKMAKSIGEISVAVARESLSATQMQADNMAGIVKKAPDIALCCSHRPAYKGGEGLVIIDSVVSKVSLWLEEAAKEMGAKFIRLCEWQHAPEDLINYLARADAVVSGRFHGMIFSILAGAPFITVPSNTWKTEGAMADMGLEDFHHRSKESVIAAIHSKSFARVNRTMLSAVEKEWSDIFNTIKGIASTPLIKGNARSPLPSSLWFRPKTVVLVGNGPSVEGKGLGKIIDASDEVVRFNNFRLNGFEDDVGSKTTLWSTFGQGMVPADCEPPQRVIMVHENAKPACSPKEIFRIPQTFYSRWQKEIRSISRHKNADTVNPTSGFLVAMWLLENGCPLLHLAGFDHFKKHKSGQHHYWNGKTFARPSDHDGDAEAELLQSFVKDGRIAYLC